MRETRLRQFGNVQSPQIRKIECLLVTRTSIEGGGGWEDLRNQIKKLEMILRNLLTGKITVDHKE